MMTFVRGFAFSSALLFIFSANAFIPRAQFILREATELSGKGPFLIEKTVHFKDGLSSVHLREAWVVDGENSMKVTVRHGSQVVYQALFLNGKKYEGGKAARGENLSDDFFEKYFVTRQSRKWLEDLVQMKILGSDSLQARPIKEKELKDYKYTGDANVRLARTNGLIAFALGKVGNDSDAYPGFWFDQHSFQLVRLRTPNNAEVRTHRQITATKGMLYPAEFFITWNGRTVDMHTKTIESLKTVGKNFDASTLSPAKWDSLPASNLRPMIEEFYSRFR